MTSSFTPSIRWSAGSRPTATTSPTSPTSMPTASARQSLILNHKIDLSVGHDEYWSGAGIQQCHGRPECRRQPGLFQRQRGLLEDALGDQHRPVGTRRTARWCATRRRMPTRRSVPLDTSPTWTWTGTRQDPRFSPPADGGIAQNQLTGTFFTVNQATDPRALPSRCPEPMPISASGAIQPSPSSRRVSR